MASLGLGVDRLAFRLFFSFSRTRCPIVFVCCKNLPSYQVSGCGGNLFVVPFPFQDDSGLITSLF